jgi:HD-GYP domain-containing protein (c-di-GMP phosphodiesterase class II)
MTTHRESTGNNGFKATRRVQRLAAISEEDDVFSSLARVLKRRIKSSWTVVYLLDRNGHVFTPPRSYGLPEKLQPEFREMPLLPDREAHLRRLLASRRHILLPDPSSSDMLAPAFRHSVAPFTLLAVPMRVQQQIQGVVLLARPRKLPPLTAAELATIRELVLQASLVASHIRLFDESLDMSIEMAQRIDMILTLDEVNKAISSSLSNDLIIATAADRIEGLVQCELQAIAVKSGDSLKIVSVRSGTGIPNTLEPGKVLRNQGCVHRALSTGRIQNIPGPDGHLQPCMLLDALKKKGINSLMVVPLVTSKGARGLLILGDRMPGSFKEKELFVIEKIASQLAVALENARLYEEMRQLFFSTVASLANAIDAKSPWTKGHSERVMHGAVNIARELGMDEEGIERVRLGGLLHDIGKIGVMEALLEKPTELDDDEFPPIRLHPEKGVAILAPIEQLKDVLPGILHHHENFDGTGYPGRLAGETIPLDARIIAVADSFDAMVADRPYRKGLGVTEAANELARCAGTQFDPEIVDCFCSRLARLAKDPHLCGRGK